MLYDSLVRKFAEKTFAFWERLGIHLTPVHYYSPIPKVRSLRKQIWSEHSEMLGVDMNERAQLCLLDTIMEYKTEYDEFGLHEPNVFNYYVYNGRFGEIDGDVLYSMVRHLKPHRVIEIGSGWSTHVIVHAVDRNKEEGQSCRITAVEPFPVEWLERNSIELISKPVQETTLDMYESLEAGDILFIDSSHVAALGTDTCYEFFQILPRLQSGVYIHFHDIFLPYEYPESWLKLLRFWNEQYLLHAFLMNNSDYEVVFAAHWLSRTHKEQCERAFRSRSAQSFWIRKL
jgi:hypothetical protein